MAPDPANENWNQEVVGESDYQKVLKTVTAFHRDRDGSHWRGVMYLHHDARNRHDRNAVSVHVPGAIGMPRVGYIPAQDKNKLGYIETMRNENLKYMAVRARIIGGPMKGKRRYDDKHKGVYGVELDTVTPINASWISEYTGGVKRAKLKTKYLLNRDRDSSQSPPKWKSQTTGSEHGSKRHSQPPPPADGQIVEISDEIRQHCLNLNITGSSNYLGKVRLGEDSKLEFPELSDNPGVYCFTFVKSSGEITHYVGETEKLRRRFRNYRNPGPSQPTNLRLNALMEEILNNGGEVRIDLITLAESNGNQLELRDKISRLLVEQAWLLTIKAEGLSVENAWN